MALVANTITSTTVGLLLSLQPSNVNRETSPQAIPIASCKIDSGGDNGSNSKNQDKGPTFIIPVSICPNGKKPKDGKSEPKGTSLTLDA